MLFQGGVVYSVGYIVHKMFDATLLSKNPLYLLDSGSHLSLVGFFEVEYEV
jgi:hypothetical protein